MRRWAALAGVALIACGCGGGGASSGTPATPSQAQLRAAEVAATFPATQPGYGVDPLSPTTPITSDETAAVVLYGEALRARATRASDAIQRVQTHARYLIANQDADGDGFASWGLGVAWDAFGDKSVNPANTPYCVTNAIVMEALMEAEQSGALDSVDRQAAIAATVSSARWTLTDGYLPSGYFAYSGQPSDHQPVLNVTAYCAGVLARVMAMYPDRFTATERDQYAARIDNAITNVLGEVVSVDGAPQWTYHSRASTFWATHANEPNDLFHHVYIVWGLLNYQRFAHRVSLGWSNAAFAQSLHQYFSSGRVYGYPSAWPFSLGSDFGKPSRVWGPGMACGVAHVLGDDALADAFMAACVNDYPGYPQCQTMPAWYGTSDPTWYPRFTSNILWGLALRAHGPTW